MFRKLDLFRLQMRKEDTYLIGPLEGVGLLGPCTADHSELLCLQLGPLERANLNHWTTPVRALSHYRPLN
jgi:hypothetical protein